VIARQTPAGDQLSPCQRISPPGGAQRQP